MSCEPWQLTQVAASDAPILWLMPWMLAAYSATAWSWQEAHCAGGSFEACGASVIAAWQSTQLSFPWTDLAKGAARTPIHTGCSPFLRGLNSASWQSMQSLLATAGFTATAAEGAGATGSAARPSATANPSSVRTRKTERQRPGREVCMAVTYYAAKLAQTATQALTVHAQI